MNIQALREKRNAIAKELRDMMEGPAKDKWNDTFQAKYDEGMAQLEDLKTQIKRIEDLHAAMADDHATSQMTEAANRHERDTGSVASKLFSKWLRVGDKGMTDDDWTQIHNTMSTTTPSEGGYTVPVEVAKTVAEALKKFGGMREVATVITTETGVQMNYPTSDGSAEEGEQVAESTQAAALDVSFGNVGLSTYKYSSKTVAVPIELLQDSSIDIEAFVKNRLVKRIARITNKKFTIGTGTNEPRGIVTAAGAGKVGATGQTLTVTWQDMIDLIHSIDPAYRELNNCRFMMNDSSLKVMRKINDPATNRPVFMPGYEGLGGAMQDTIFGYNVAINQSIADMAANAKSILFGDFSFYVIRDALQNQFYRFTDSAYASKGQVGFLMFARSGGNYTDVGGGVKYYQNSAT